MQTTLQCHTSTLGGRPQQAVFTDRRRAARQVGRERSSLHVVAAVRRGSDKTIVCSKTVVAKTGSEAAVQDLCQEVLHFSRQRMEDRENGILQFEVNHDLEDGNVFHFWEQYTSNATLGRHNTQPEFTKFMEDVQQYTEGPVGMALYEMKNGQISNVCIQGGPKGEGGLDDATGAGGSGGGASYKQSSGTVDLGRTEDEEVRDTTWGLNFKFPWQVKENKEKAKK